MLEQTDPVFVLDEESVEPQTAIERERIEDFLYFHLDVARRARLVMDAMREWSMAYAMKHREREVALAAASRNYEHLRDSGGIPPLLAEMALHEGLLP